MEPDLNENQIISVTPSRSRVKIAANFTTRRKVLEDLLFEFSAWMRFQIIAYHLIEPVLIACLIGACLNLPQLETLCIIIVSMGLYFPFLLSAVAARIKVKIIASIISLVFVFFMLIFKLVVYFGKYKTFETKTNLTKFLGIYFDNPSLTFVIDAVNMTLIALILWIQCSQFKQCNLSNQMGDKKLSKQIEIKYRHPVFGQSIQVFYVISYLLFILNTFVFQSFLQLAILCAQLVLCYMWGLNVEISTTVRKQLLRTMQVVSFLFIFISFLLILAYYFDGFLNETNDQRVIQLMGLMWIYDPTKAFWRVHLVLQALSIILSEVYFVAEDIHSKVQMRAQAKADQQNQKSQGIERLKLPLVLWIARVGIFIWCYMFHDYQSLILLIWIIHSTLYIKTPLFVKTTLYFYLPIFNLLLLWYFTTNVYGVIEWNNFSEEQTLNRYRYGFFKMTMAFFEFGFMFFNIFIVTFYCRLNLQKHNNPLQSDSILKEMDKKDQPWGKIFYLAVLYIEYPLYLALVLSALTKMDFYHIFLLFIFVAYTIFPSFFLKNTVFLLLIYTEFFVFAKYIWTLVTNTIPSQTSWLNIIGISSRYNPQNTNEYFRYVPMFDQWILVLLTYCLYQRSYFIGTDQNQIKQQELNYIKDLYYKSPTTKKIFVTIDILISHLIIIVSFLFFVLILVFMRRSFLNLVSLIIVLTTICSYMSRGIHKLNYYWNILTFYQAFVLLSILVYQFVFQSGLSEQQWFINRQYQNPRFQAYAYWAGYYIFDPIWSHFAPYVILFSFAVAIRGRMRQKQVQENLRETIVLPEQFKSNSLLYSNNETESLFQDEEERDKREQALENSMISANQNSQMTRQEAEAQLTDYQIKLQESYFNMLYQIQYPIWKSKALWPVYTWISRYFNFMLSVVIFCFAIYFQIALIWLIFLIIYLIQAWQTSNMHIKYKIEQYCNFQPSLQQKTTAADDGNQEQTEEKITITEQEVYSEYEKFQQNVHKTSLQSRHQYWIIQFTLLIVSTVMVYLSDYITATYTTNSNPSTNISLISDVKTQNTTLFIFFWSGFLGSKSTTNNLEDRKSFIKAYWPFFILLFLLIIEKISQFWLTDKFGTNEELISKWEKIEKLYYENYVPEDVSNSMKATASRKQMTKSLNFMQNINQSNEQHYSQSIPKVDNPISSLEQQSKRFSASQPKKLAQSTNLLQQNTVSERLNDQQESQQVFIEEEFLNSDFQKETDYQRQVIEQLYPNSNSKSEQMKQILNPMLTVNSKVILHRALKIFFEEFIILLVWFSLIYKESVFSFLLFIVLAYHTFSKSQRDSDKPMLLVRYTIVFILIYQYGIYLANLSSYSSPTPFPVQIAPNGIYPSWNSTTNSYEYYYYIPVYFFYTPFQSKTPPSINVNLYTYLSIFIDSDQKNGMWIDFVITLLVVFYLDSCNFFIITKSIKIVSSQECETKIQEYAKIASQSGKTTKQVKKEVSNMIGLNIFVDYCSKWLYQYFIIFMITWLIIISVYSRTLITFGYFLFCTILIFRQRIFFLTNDSHLFQQKLLRQGLLPFLLLDILMNLIYQLPINAFDDQNKNWPNMVGFQKYWVSTPLTLFVGFDGKVSTYLQNPLTPLYLKGITYFFIMIQLAIIESKGFIKYKQKLCYENKSNKNCIGLGIAYRFNNFKSKQILENAKSLSDLEKMLFDVKQLIERRDKIFKRNQQLMKQENNPKNLSITMPEIVEEEEIVPQILKKNYKKEFITEVKQEVELRMKKLNCCERMYLRLRLYYVEDILFKKSQEHLEEIVKEFEGGRTNEMTNLERGITIQVKLELLTKMKQDIVEQNELKEEKLRYLKDTVDAEMFKVALEKEQVEAEKQINDYIKFKNKQLNSIQLKPWQRIDIETFQSWQTLAFSYLNLGQKILKSHTEWICYFFMLFATFNNGGLLYQVYPLMIFGYALLEESKPGKTFWFFTIIYTQLILLAQFTIQLRLWDIPFFSGNFNKFLTWTQKWNLGLEKLQDYSFGSCCFSFIPEILIVIFVTVHIQLETINGVFDKKHYDFESFQEGLQRYQLAINKNEKKTYERLQKMFQVQSVIRNDLEYDEILKSRPRRAQSLDFQEFTYLQREQIQINNLILSYKDRWSRTPILRSQPQIFGTIDVEKGSKSTIGSEENEKLTLAKKLQAKIWDIGFFQRLFPQISQQKPGKDYYTWTTLISIFICFYILFFFTKMSGQQTTFSQQYSQNLFQKGMILTLFAMIAIMVIDRIFYGSHSQIKINTQNQNETVSTENERSFTQQDNLQQKRQTIIQQTASGSFLSQNRINNSNQSILLQNQQESRSTSIQEKSQELSVTDVDRHDQAFDEALIPVYRKDSWKRKIKVFYFWVVLFLVQWYVFFFLPNQTKYCTVAGPFCNKFRKNPSLICFYTFWVLYFILQAFQLQAGLPELRKGGFMIGQYDSISKYIFTVWYYIPFLFELRSIIDWTFSTTALDIFQWLKLAQVQADLYMAKCQQRSYRQKPLGSKIATLEQGALGCGLLVFILALIAGPLILFSSLNPVRQQNSVSAGTLGFDLVVQNNTQLTNYNVTLFQTTQVTSVFNLSQQNFDSLGFQNYPSTTGQYEPSQVQSIQFAQASDTVWTASTPIRSFTLSALQLVQNQDPNISITAMLTARFVRPSGITSYESILHLTNQTQPTIIQTLIDQIQCTNNGTSPIINKFPSFVNIAVDCGTSAQSQAIQPGQYIAGFDLIYNCESVQSANYWGLNMTYDISQLSQQYDSLFPEDGFGYFTFSQFTQPSYLSAASAGIIVFYGTIVYVIATSLRSGLVPMSYEIFITDAPLTEDLLMICTSISIYRMQRDLSQEEQLYYILIDIMRSPEMIKELTKSSLKYPAKEITQS